jgi:hypothetical protein
MYILFFIIANANRFELGIEWLDKWMVGGYVREFYSNCIRAVAKVAHSELNQINTKFWASAPRITFVRIIILSLYDLRFALL